MRLDTRHDMSRSEGSLVLLRDDDQPDIEVRSVSAGSNRAKRQKNSPAVSISIGGSSVNMAGRRDSPAASSGRAEKRTRANPNRGAHVHVRVKKPRPPRPTRAIPMRAAPVVYAEPEEGDYEELMNPVKRRPQREEDEEDEQEVASAEGFEAVRDTYEEAPEQEIKPSEGYKTLDDEKHDLLLKLFRLKERGYPVRGFTLSSDVLEMRTDYAKASYQDDMSSGLEFCKDTMITLTNALEKFNNRFDPFDFNLDGFAQHTYMEVHNKRKYDVVLEKLIAKHRKSVSCPPEMLFLFMFGSSALQFHMAHSQSKVLGPELSAAIQRDPEILQRVLQEVRQGEVRGSNYAQPVPPPAATPPAPVPSNGARRPMRGPGVDMSRLAGMMPFGASVRQTHPPLYQPPPVYDPNPAATEDDIGSIPDSFSSGVSEVSNTTKEVMIDPPGKKGRKRRNGKVVQIG